MKITAISSLKYNNQPYHIQNTATKAPQTQQSGVYNPIAYNDYNVRISFGKRSPEDFYSQNFANNMPETTKQYLHARFDERSKIAPVQLMQEAFDDLHLASTVEDIKELFPNEPKFAKLRPANYSTATTGILKKIKDIKAMQETPEPLFKDGSDDLTAYLVKKIYLEGKTVKEIDKDFAHDINEIYELAARVPDEARKSLGKNESLYFSNSTTYSLGIRFPELPFWNAFIATRDDYERTNRVKTVTGTFVNADSLEGKAEIARRQAQRSQEPPKPRKYTFKRHDIKQISDSIVNSRGETTKALRRARSNRNAEELTFLQKYWSQIMSVAAEKVHLSDELIDFNAQRKAGQTKVKDSVMDKLISGADLDAAESTPFKIFWNERTDLKGHFSNAITDTVMLFTDEFGADGNNPRFQALLEYANRIKPEREARKLQHAAIQAEYDEMARTLTPPEVANPSAQAQIQELQSRLKAAQPEEFVYIIDGHKITMPYDIRLQALQGYENEFTLLPKKMHSLYISELDKIIKDDKMRFYLSCCLEQSEDTPEVNKILYSNDYMRSVNQQIVDAMESFHNADIEAARLALFQYAQKRGILTPEFIKEHANCDLLAVRDSIFHEVQKTGEIDSATKDIQQAFNTICARPLTNKEKTACRLDLFAHLRKFDMNTSTLHESIPRMIQLISNTMKEKPQYVEEVKSMLNAEKLFADQGPVLRLLLDSKTDAGIKNMIRDHAFQHILRYYPEAVSIIATQAKDFKSIMQNFPTEMHGMLQLAKQTLFQHNFRLK